MLKEKDLLEWIKDPSKRSIEVDDFLEWSLGENWNIYKTHQYLKRFNAVHGYKISYEFNNTFKDAVLSMFYEYKEVKDATQEG